VYWNYRRDDRPVAFRGIPDEILAVHGDIHRLAQPDISPRAARFAHIEEAKHRHEAATAFHVQLLPEVEAQRTL
jgi:hypothetical protein